MAVAVVRQISGGTEYATETFARATMDAWGVGKAACNNGIVLALAIEDRHMYIATGRGAAEYLADRELKAAIERMKPLLRELRYAEACEQAVSDVARVLSGESIAPSWLAEYGFIIGFVVLFVAFVLQRLRSQAKYNRCKRALAQIEKERAEARAERYHVTSCAICLETFASTPRMSTRLFPCGHNFHGDCVQRWESSHGSCPMCRQQTDTQVPEYRGAQSGWNYDDEYRYRIHRVRTLYPDYVSHSMSERWCIPGYRGSLAADTAFIRNSPSYSAPSSGGSGGSSSFGGGCSSGGGGAGGSW